jgi:hypothetical protein
VGLMGRIGQIRPMGNGRWPIEESQNSEGGVKNDPSWTCHNS